MPIEIADSANGVTDQGIGPRGIDYLGEHDRIRYIGELSGV